MVLFFYKLGTRSLFVKSRLWRRRCRVVASNRIIPSELQMLYATLSEQGYEFEEIINAVDGEDAETPVSGSVSVYLIVILLDGQVKYNLRIRKTDLQNYY